MALDAIIFDVDGTLLDTNAFHVEAWRRAFERFGYRIPRDRIEVEVGKGGDQLVPSVLGEVTARTEGKRLREAQAEEFQRITDREPVLVLPGVPELFRTLRERGLRIAVATSSSRRKLDLMADRAGLPLGEIADVVVTSDDAAASKPAPDLVAAAVRKLRLSPAQCAMVGDTVYDVQSANGAGVVCLAVLTGGNPRTALIEVGARGVWRDTGALLDDLDEALRRASPGAAHLTHELLERLMREALAAARQGLAAHEAPIGCVLARGDGTVLARAYDEVRRTRVPTAHAEMVAFDRAAGSLSADARDTILVSTLEPCVMCTGAAMETAVDTIVYGLPVPADGGSGRVRPPIGPGNRMPRIVGAILAEESRRLFEAWLAANGSSEQAPYVRRLLADTAEAA